MLKGLMHLLRTRNNGNEQLLPVIFLDVLKVALCVAVVAGTVTLLQSLSLNSSSTILSSSTKSLSALLLQENESSPSSSPSSSISLRYDWTNLSLSSYNNQSLLSLRFASVIREHQSNCSLPLGDFRHRNKFGLGSDLHVWTQALCNAMQQGVRIRTQEEWIYNDNTVCKNNIESHSGMSCYFPQSEPRCESESYRNNNDLTFYSKTMRFGDFRQGCNELRKRYKVSFSDVRAAGIEYLFSKTGPPLVREAERQLALLFGGNNRSTMTSDDDDTQPNLRMPKHLITVHIHWGDKKSDMELRPIQEYVDAVKRLVESYSNNNNNSSTATSSSSSSSPSVGIFLATEDPQAVQEFQQAATFYNWTVYVDVYFQEFAQSRLEGYNNHVKLADNLKGRPGLVALASLLVALEANDYVLTTCSNWSRLLNELRKNILDPRCNSCTRMIDLSPEPCEK